MNFLVRWAINTIALGAAVLIVKGIMVSGVFSLIIASLLIGFLNATIKPIFLLFTLPLNILTLGTFTLVINTIMIIIASEIVRGFEVSGFWSAFVAALIMSIISFLLDIFMHRNM